MTANDKKLVLPWESLGSTPDLESLPDPLIILGMHNSGTTLLAGILHNRGVFLGCNAGMNESFFFSHFLANRIVMGGEEAAWAKLPIMSVKDVLSKRAEVETLIRKYWFVDYVQWGYDGAGFWGFKDPRSCVLLPLYQEIFSNPKLLIIRRNLEDIAASLAHRFKPGLGILSDVGHWHGVASAYMSRVDEFASNSAQCCEVEYEQLCREPAPVLEKIYNFMGVPLSNETIAYAKGTVSIASIGTRHWTERRWRSERRKKRLKRIFGPLYDAIRGRL